MLPGSVPLEVHNVTGFVLNQRLRRKGRRTSSSNFTLPAEVVPLLLLLGVSSTRGVSLMRVVNEYLYAPHTIDVARAWVCLVFVEIPHGCYFAAVGFQNKVCRNRVVVVRSLPPVSARGWHPFRAPPSELL